MKGWEEFNENTSFLVGKGLWLVLGIIDGVETIFWVSLSLTSIGVLTMKDIDYTIME